MKRNIRQTLLAPAVLLLATLLGTASCTQDDEQPGSSVLPEGKIALVPTVAPDLAWSTTDTDAPDAPGTRADATLPVTLAAGGEVWIGLVPIDGEGNPGSSLGCNYFTVSADGKLTRLAFAGRPNETEAPLSIDAPGQYVAQSEGNVNLTMDGIACHAYIRHEVEVVTIGTDGKLTVTFPIESGGLRLNVKNTDGGAYTGADVTATLKTVTHHDSKEFDVKTLTADAPAAIWGDIAQTSSVSAGDPLLELATGGKTYRVLAPRQISFTRARLYTFNVRVGATGITVSSDDLTVGDFEVQPVTNAEAAPPVVLQPANCHMVDASGKAYSFKATVMGNGKTTRADGANTADIVPTTLNPASAVVLWEQSDPSGVSNAAGDVVTNVRLENGYIHFTTGTKPGNAVIAALDGGGNIIWSWHIWRPESNPGDVECYTPKNGGRNFKMMALNLGALNNEVNDVKAYGLMYQWGRKDPFPGATGISANDGGTATFNGVVTENGYSFAAVSGAVTAETAVQNAMNFYYNNNADWISTQQDNLWGNPYPQNVARPNPDLGSKSIYDPCPVGYRVAPQDTWSQNGSDSDWATNGQNLKVGKNGVKYFYPASGVRWGDSDAGKLAYVGSNGRYWSSSPYSNGSTNGGGLYFDDGDVYPENSSYRAYGMSVRCVQEQ